MNLLPIDVVYQTAVNLYVIIHAVIGGVQKVWNPTLNTGAGGFESYDSGHWADYAIALTEQAGSGYYAAVYPAAIAASEVLTREAIYVRNGGSPTLGDAPATPIVSSQGGNVAGVGADPVAALNLLRALLSEKRGVAAGTPTVSIIPTDLDTTLVDAFAGRVIAFTTGAAAGAVGRIARYAADGTVTLLAPLPAAPDADDEFVIF